MFNPQAARERCEAGVEHRQTGQNVAEDGWCISCGDRWPCITAHLAAALEALEEAEKVINILRPSMNLGVVQVPPPIQDADRLYALKDAIKAYDAILGESK